jgi:hypothetical protein
LVHLTDSLNFKFKNLIEFKGRQGLKNNLNLQHLNEITLFLNLKRGESELQGLNLFVQDGLSSKLGGPSLSFIREIITEIQYMPKFFVALNPRTDLQIQQKRSSIDGPLWTEVSAAQIFLGVSSRDIWSGLSCPA